MISSRQNYRAEMTRAFMVQKLTLKIGFFVFRVFAFCALPCAFPRSACVFYWFRGCLFPLVCSFFLGLLLSQAGQVSVWDKYNPKKYGVSLIHKCSVKYISLRVIRMLRGP